MNGRIADNSGAGVYKEFIPGCDTDPMVDNARIEELKREVGEEDLALVLGIFVTEAERTIARIATGLPDSDLAKAIHFLRSGALNIGLTSLANRADAAAGAPPDAQIGIAGQLMETLQQSVQRIGLPTAANSNASGPG